MASEEPGNTETEGEVDTVVFKKKRANRRVSFADVEITSVHIFNRDDDFSEDQPATPNSSHCGPDRELLGFFRDLADSDDSPPNPELDDPPNSFLRPIGSPSPGSSTVGSASAASNDDEDNFFGPVSANFIRPGRLSDSGASDDITMDSTAFSMHFRSLARSDSGGGGDLKTPTMSTAHRLLAFEDSATTPSHNATSTDSASFMVLTKAKKSMVPVDKVSSAGVGGNDSNDMSIVGENARSYDYGRISPRLDALLAEGSNILNSISIDSKCIMASEDMHEMPAEAVSLPRTKMSEASGGSTDIPVDQITYDHQIQTPKQLIEGVKEFSENAIEMFRPIPQFTDDNRGTPSNKDGIFEFRRSDSDINQKSGERYRSFLEESISLLSSKQQQSFVNTPNSAKHMGIVTPSSKLPGFFSSKESIRHGESLSSLQKSISKFKIPEPSPSSSTLKEGIEKLKRRLSNYSSMPSSFNTVLAGNSKDPQEGHADTHIAHLEEHLCTADLKNEEKNLINIDGDGIETPKNIGNLSQNEVILGFAKDGESPNHTSLGLVSKYKKPMTAAGSPSQFTRSGSKLVQNFSMSENPTEGTLVTSGTDSSSVEITLDYRKNKKVAGMPDNFVSSPVKGQDLSACMEYQDCVSRDLKQLGQYNKLFSGSGQGGDSIQHVNGDSHSSLVADKLDSLLSEMRAESDASFLRTNHVKEFGKVERVLDNNIGHLCNESEKFINIQSPLRDKVTMNFQFESTDKNLQAGADPRQFKLYSPRRKNEPSLEKSPSKKDLAHSLTLKESAQSSYRKRPTWSPTSKESTPSPSRQDPSSASHNYVMPPFVGKVVLSPRSSSSRRDNNFHDEVHISQSPFPAQDIDIYSGRKRRNVETAFGDGDHIDKLTKIQRSPKGDKSGGHNLEFMLEHANEVNNEGETIGDDKTRMHWADILVKFLGDTKQLLSGSIDNLNLKAIWLLEDFVARLLKVKKYEILCSEIQSQGKVDPFSSVRHKRVAETRLLLYEIAYKKANLQLMGLKRDILLKRVQRLSSGIQECRVLKLKIEHLSKYGAGDAQIDNSLHQTSLVNFEGMHEACCDEVATRRQEFEDLDRKIESLCKSFHSNCRTKGEPNCANTLALVHDQLKNRMCCRFIRQDLQLWEVDDFERRNGHYDILLNYQGYISQRFTVNTGPLSSIIISNKLNDINILKNFPNMDVGIAFSFLVNAETTKKYVGSRCLAQETQISTSLLSNLLDVVEEVQLTQIEIRNLVQTGFHSPSVNQLDLQLCFIEFYSGGKVTLTLDMTCLNRGVYPSEILPNEIQAATAGPEKSWPQSIIAEIRAAAENLTTGYSRIMRLCRSVSEVVQASSRCMVPGGV